MTAQPGLKPAPAPDQPKQDGKATTSSAPKAGQSIDLASALAHKSDPAAKVAHPASAKAVKSKPEENESVGIIVITLFIMLVLAILALVTYLKTQPAVV